MNLVVGDLSTWSMRAWLCLRMANLEFEVTVIPLGAPGYREQLARHSDSMLVPVLDAGEATIHDSLAIAEYANEISGGALLPQERIARAHCRSLCSELHSGFVYTRKLCPFAWAPPPLQSVPDEVQSELDRLAAIWAQAQGGFYFGRPTMADAFYSVMACRLDHYGLRLPGAARRYQQQLLAWPLFQELVIEARRWAQAGA